MNQQVLATATFTNTTDYPYTMDREGHVLGGGETGEYKVNAQTMYGVSTDRLIQHEPAPEGDTSKDAVVQADVPVQKKRTSKSDSTNESQEK